MGYLAMMGLVGSGHFLHTRRETMTYQWLNFKGAQMVQTLLRVFTTINEKKNMAS